MDELKAKIKELTGQLKKLKELLGVEVKRKTVEKLQMEMAAPNFWQDQKKVSQVVGELKAVKSDVDDWEDLNRRFQEAQELFALEDAGLSVDIHRELDKLAADLDKLSQRALFSEKFDGACAIVEINSGAGGTEACDWSSMLFRMYFRWAEEKKFKIKVLEEVKGEEAGIKNITFFIEGARVYGLLKSERGVHRLVRISPFDANKRRHTSFASVDILPEIKEDIGIEIKPEELRVDTFRASGAGGQHVNVTDSAVRITHLPTGFVASSQNERSQHQNRQAALKVLKAKLYERREQEQKKELARLQGKKQRIEWGSQIRSYILHPYLLVKDHRTDLESHDARAVLDGKLDDFMYAYLKFIKSEDIR